MLKIDKNLYQRKLVQSTFSSAHRTGNNNILFLKLRKPDTFRILKNSDDDIIWIYNDKKMWR